MKAKQALTASKISALEKTIILEMYTVIAENWWQTRIVQIL